MNIITAQNIIYKESLTLKAQAVFLYLADRSNKQNICWPGLKKIAADCRISISTVQRAINELLKLGLLLKKPNFRENGSQTSNIYVVTEKLEEKETVKKENCRVQRKIEQRMKKQAKKEKLAAMFKEAITLGQNDDIVKLVESCNDDNTKCKKHKISDTISRPVHNVKIFLKKINFIKPFNFNFLSRGVVRKNTQEPKHIIFTNRKRKIE